MNKTVITGLVAGGIGLSSCGGNEAVSLPSQREALDEIHHIVRDIDTQYAVDGVTDFRKQYFNHLHKVDVYTKDIGFTALSGVAYGDAYTSATKASTSWYVKGQAVAANIAHTYRNIRLPVVSSGGTSSTSLATKLNIIEAPTILVLTNEKAFTGENTRKDNRAPSAQTYQPESISAKYATSFVAGSGSTLFDRLSLATEGCQAKVRVSAEGQELNHSAQETICNSIGRAIAYAGSGFTYEQYRTVAKLNGENKVAGYAIKGGAIEYITFPMKAYVELSRGNEAVELQGAS